MRFLDKIEDFEYQGINVPIMIWYEEDSGRNTLYRFEFEYKGVREFDWYNREDSGDAYSLTRLYCQIIDKHGSDGVNRFKACKSKISEIEDKYIVVDDKVFKFDKFSMDIHPHKIHRMQIKMEDGKILDGDSIMNRDVYIKDKDEYSYYKTLDNLRNKVKLYFRDNKTVPSKECFLEETTKKYNELWKEYREITK